MSIKTSQYRQPTDDYMYVAADVDIENKGNRHTQLVYGEGGTPFSVFRVDHNADGSLKFGDATSYPVVRGQDPEKAVRSMIVRAGGRETIPFYFRVSSPGVYLLVFRAPIPKSEQELLEGALRHEFSRPFAWVAKEYLVVNRPHQNHSS
jgi:hypothetical protein